MCASALAVKDFNIEGREQGVAYMYADTRTYESDFFHSRFPAPHSLCTLGTILVHSQYLTGDKGKRILLPKLLQRPYVGR